MLDNILGLVKGVAQDTVSSNVNVAEDKKDQVVETATNAITSSLTNNLSGLTSLFSGEGSSSLVDTIQKTVVTALSEKVGLSASVANGIASAIVPAVISAISGKVSDSNEKGFSLESIIGAFSGDDKKSGGILGTIGNLFGK